MSTTGSEVSLRQEAAAPRELSNRNVSFLTEEQKDLVKRTIAPDATDDELALFIYQCERTGLDPFSKQIYSIKRGDHPRQTQIAIDGARLIAERSSHAYRPGPVEWMTAQGEWGDSWTIGGHPAAARATVYKDGEPVTAVANYNEFVQTVGGGSPNRQWKQMPAHMLAKCAEMLALRRAFPQELSGLQIAEEPPLAGPKEATVEIGEEPASAEQLAALADLLAKLMAQDDVSQDALDDRLRERYGTATLSELTHAQAQELLGRLSE